MALAILRTTLPGGPVVQSARVQAHANTVLFNPTNLTSLFVTMFSVFVVVFVLIHHTSSSGSKGKLI